MACDGLYAADVSQCNLRGLGKDTQRWQPASSWRRLSKARPEPDAVSRGQLVGYVGITDVWW
jgi:hypothetical protein